MSETLRPRSLLRRFSGAVRRVDGGRARRSGRGDRRQRRRQEHAAQKHRRAPARTDRCNYFCRRADRRHAGLCAGRARHRAGARGQGVISFADGRGKSLDRRSAPSSGRLDAAACLRTFSRARRAAQIAEHGALRRPAANGRALLANPQLLLCDEISLGLAPIVVRDIYARLPAVLAEGTAIVLVEQDVVQALAAAARVYCLQEGRVALSGAAKDLTREAIAAAYFGV